MIVAPGSRLGPYELTHLLGAGGMGEVYRARDTRLKREVAIKALPPEFAFDPERVARFRREAEALAALNHRHIAGIYDLLEVDGSQFLVLELVEGETIADRLARGPIPLQQTLPIARQIAEALEAAHARGIVHRDLKPANVKLDPNGQVKVLDLGLAKDRGTGAHGHSGAGWQSAANSPTFAAPSGTLRGVILGTAAYMSPEQARGEAVGPQADIWALGCVLYEMLTGRPCFDGRTPTDILAAVVRADPDWEALPVETPRSVRTLLRRCLQKDASRRLHHVADVRIDLDEVEGDAGTDHGHAATTRRRASTWITAAASALATAALVGSVLLLRPRLEAIETHLELTTPPSNDPISFAIAPDGLKIVFVANDVGGSRLWLRSFHESVARPLPGTELATLPFWSADSRSLGFFADGKLKRVDIASGLIVALADAPIGAGGTWNRDGVIVYAPSAIGSLFRVPAAGGQAVALEQLPTGVTGHRLPTFLPDGAHYIFYSRGLEPQRGVYVASLSGERSRRLFDSDTAAVLAGDYLLFARQNVLFAQRFDLSRRDVVGDSFAVADRVATDNGASSIAASASHNGHVVYRRGGAVGQRRLVWVDRAGQVQRTVGPPDNTSLFNPELSPDGSTIVLQRNVEVAQDIWQVDLTRGLFSRVTFEPMIDQIPIWSPDGRRIVFSSNLKGAYDLYERILDGSASNRPLLVSEQNKFAMGFSPDGRYLLYRNTNTNTNWDLWVLPLEGDRIPQPIATSRFQEMMGAFSPDGRWIAYQTNESGQHEIVVQSFPDAKTRVVVSTNGGAQPRWRGDSKELYYVGLDSRLMAVSLSVTSSGVMTPSTPVALFPLRTPGGPVPIPQKQQFVVAADGQRFLVNSLTDEAVASPLSVILNWKAQSGR